MLSNQGASGRIIGMRVLVVDSEPAICDFVAAVLNDIGCTVKGAATVREAHELARCENFDVALIEVMLPDGHGDELGKSLSRIGVRTTLMSGHPDGIAVRDSAPDKFLTKPFGVAEVLRIVVDQWVGEASGDRR